MGIVKGLSKFDPQHIIGLLKLTGTLSDDEWDQLTTWVKESFAEIERLQGRLNAYNDDPSITRETIIARVGVYAKNIDLIKSALPGYDTEHGEEPTPFVMIENKRFINVHWRDWYHLVTKTEISDISKVECCKRGIEMLYPVPETRLGLNWELGTGAYHRSKVGEPIFPNEVVLWRETITKV